MAFRPPSLQNTYNEYSKYDPAFRQLPAKATDKQAEKYEATVKRCRERGDWTELRIEGGGEPTQFELRPMPGSVYRPLMDLAFSNRVGPAQMASLALRVVLISVTNLEEGGTEVAFARYDGLPGVIATADVPDKLDALDTKIVLDLGQAVLDRAKTPAPRS